MREWGLGDDLLQETLLRAFVALPHLQNPACFPAWLYGIAANLARWWWRRQARWPLSLEGLAAAYPDVPWDRHVASGALPEALVEEAEQGRRLRDAVLALPPLLGRAVALYYLEDLSYAEIAAALEVPVSTVKGRLFKSRAVLREVLIDDAPPGVGGARRPRQARGERGATTVASEDVRMIPVTVDAIQVPQATAETTAASIEISGSAAGSEPGMAEFAAAAPSDWMVLLRERGGDRQLCIRVGVAEGIGLALHLRQEQTPRPITYDLVKALLDLGGSSVERAAVIRLENDTFFATLTVRRPDGQSMEVDARPSDALNLAVRAGAAILVAEPLLQAAPGTA